MRGSLSTHTDSDIYSSTLQYIGMALDGTARAAPPLPLPRCQLLVRCQCALTVASRFVPCIANFVQTPGAASASGQRCGCDPFPSPLPYPPSRASRAQHKNMESKIRNLSADEVAPAKLLTKHARGRGTVVNTRPRVCAHSTPYPSRHWLPYSPMQANQRSVLRLFSPEWRFAASGPERALKSTKPNQIYNFSYDSFNEHASFVVCMYTNQKRTR